MIAAGEAPDLTEAFSAEALANLAKLRDKKDSKTNKILATNSIADVSNTFERERVKNELEARKLRPTFKGA